LPAKPAAAVGEQLGGVRVLDVLRDDEHPGLGRALAQRQRCAHALVAERRRQPHVDDGDVRAFEQDGGDEGVAVGDRADHVEAVVAEEPGEAVAEERERRARLHAT